MELDQFVYCFAFSIAQPVNPSFEIMYQSYRIIKAVGELAAAYPRSAAGFGSDWLHSDWNQVSSCGYALRLDGVLIAYPP